MKNKRTKYKILLPFLCLVPTLAIAAPFIVSCTSFNSINSNNKTEIDSNESIPTSAINSNGALSMNNHYKNGSLSNLIANWQNTLNNSSNIVLLQNDTSSISLKTNFPSNSTINWYITNDSNCLISKSILINTTNTTSSSETISTTIPEGFVNKINQFTYYVFAIVSNSDAKYPVQVDSAVLNSTSNYPIKITSGWLRNETNDTQAICENTNITLSIDSTKLNSNSSNDYVYSWVAINHATNTTTPLSSTTNTLNYPTDSVGYVSIQCSITQNNKVIASPILNFYVSNWASLNITNENIVNSVLTVTNTNQSLGTSLTNNFIPSNSTITYQWYEKGINSNNLSSNLDFVPVGTNSNSYLLNNIVPTYTTEYKVVITFAYNDTVYTISSNIIQVYYSSNIGSISILSSTLGTNGIYTIKNGDSITFNIDTSTLNISTSLLTYQWQQLVNGSWINISNATSSSYKVVEENSTINQIRVVATLPQNWNDGSIYSNTVTVQTPAISSELSTEIYNKATAYFNNSTNFSDVWMSYFTNNSNANYWWLWETIISGWWKGSGGFATSSNAKDFSFISINNVLSCFKLTSISVVNGSFNNAKPTGSPRLVFNLQVIANNVYIKTKLGTIAIPSGYSFAFSSPIYIANVNGQSSNYSFSVASNGAVSYTISNSLGNQTNMKYYWNSSADSAWGLNFTGTVYDKLKSSGFFASPYQNTNSYTVLYNWINSPSTIIINNSTAPAMPNFYNEVVNAGVKLNATPSQTSSEKQPIAFTHDGLTLSVTASLSNGVNTTFTYAWSSQKLGSSESTNINNDTASYQPVYINTTSSYIMVYTVVITCNYEGSTFKTTIYFYVNYLPSDSSTN